MPTMFERMEALEKKVGEISATLARIAAVNPPQQAPSPDYSSALRLEWNLKDWQELVRWRAMFSSPEVCAREIQRLRDLVEASEFYSTLRSRQSEQAPA